jgi:hypothetical protein
MHGRGSNSIPPGSDMKLEGHPLPFLLQNLGDIEGASEPFYQVTTPNVGLTWALGPRPCISLIQD